MGEKAASFSVGSWVFSSTHGEPVRILDVESVWNHTVCEVWIPRLATVERVSAESLAPTQLPKASRLERIAYAVCAARIADALTQDVLLAPLEAGVIPLPHQLYALTRAMGDDQIRYLLADEVGLGKTIEAGLIFRELKLRGLVKRVLVVAPKGLVTQWVQEMQTHFGEEFRLLTPSEFSLWRNLTGADNIWRQFDQVVCPVDAIKPVEKRRGWPKDKLETHNQERLGDLIDAGWDLIICDEAHRLGGSTEQVARYRLGKALAEAAPYLLLLSATPHQGKTASFQRIMALLDPDEFNTAGAIRREKVVPLVIRTEKRRAINDRGDPLFLPRLTKLIPVRWEERHELQKSLYEAVTEYVRLGYNQAIQQNRQYLGFLMILMQRLVTSSTQAIATALERRLDALQATEITPTDEEPPESNGEEQDSQEKLDELLSIRLAGLANEKEEVRRLLDLARRCQAKGPDARAETLLGILYENQRAENNPELKYLIFTEFVPTQSMLREFLEQHGFSVTCLNGSMDLDQRRRVQREFAAKTRILVSTDAGGEGLNLQFAHVVINYDLPWNPMKIEQRIGRVDRIGQKLPVKAFNLIFENSVELRVQEVLEEKLATILVEFGVDKTEDVLDSAESGAIFEKLYAQAILNPGDIEKNIDWLIQQVREQAQQESAGRSYYGETVLDPTLAQQLSSHPLPFWVERMTTAYLRCEGGKVQRNLFGYSLDWPDGSKMERVSFHSRDAQDRGMQHVSLEDSRIRRLVHQLPRVVVTEPIPCVRFGSLSAEVIGYWSLWRITLDHQSFRDVRIIPIFHHDDGRILLPTARHIWDRLLDDRPDVEQMGTKTGADVEAVFRRLRSEAERQGEDAFHELYARHQQRLKREQEKGVYAFRVRREALNRIGLPEVRQHRLKRLDEEEKAWAEDLRKREQVLPELQPVILLRVEAGNG
ncbi:MAG: DEAD/DEAH box helicase family protein [Bryobacterales bacterium]|nr:DEAD/DEAH box helicase family protein [Bryobacterales bacterium]